MLLYLDRTGKGMEEQVITHYLENLSANRAGVVHPGSLATVRGMFERVNAGEAGVEIEYRADYHGNGYQWYRANLFVVNDEGGAWHLVGLIESIQNERELRTRAERDSVTGLNNHAAAKSAITQALADARVRSASACAVLDIDDFKQVNDCSRPSCGRRRAAVGRGRAAARRTSARTTCWAASAATSSWCS